MDLNSTEGSSVVADPALITKSTLGAHSSLMPYPQSGQAFPSSIFVVPRKKPGKLEDVLSNGWLDAMKSSSPPRKKVFKDFSSADVVLDDADIAHQSWMVCSPSIFSPCNL